MIIVRLLMMLMMTVVMMKHFFKRKKKEEYLENFFLNFYTKIKKPLFLLEVNDKGVADNELDVFINGALMLDTESEDNGDMVVVDEQDDGDVDDDELCGA